MEYKTYHYGDNNLDDSGWGCSYRNIQTILSCYKKYYNCETEIPDIKILLDFFNKNINVKNKKELWIEPYHISLYLLSNFNFSGVHYAYVINNYDFSKITKTDVSFYIENNRIVNSFEQMLLIIKDHFNNSLLPVVIDDGIYSYCFIMDKEDIIIIDPHNTENKILKKNTDFLKNKFFLYYFPRIDKV